MSKGFQYTAATKKYLLEHGYMVDDLERKNCWSGKKNDLYGFGDLLAIKKGTTPCSSRRIIVQSSSKSNHSTRKKKILGIRVVRKGKSVLICPLTPPKAKLCLECGFEIVVFTWGKIKNRWTPSIEEITLKDFPKCSR